MQLIHIRVIEIHRSTSPRLRIKLFLSIINITSFLVECQQFFYNRKSTTLYLNNPSIPNSPVYCVDVVWNDLSFEYNAGASVWNPQNHSYDNSSDAGWKDYEGKVTLTNHSNAVVSASIAFEPASTLNGTMKLEVLSPSFDLGSAEGTTLQNAPSKFSAIRASGVPVSDASPGKIVVTVCASGGNGS